MEVIEEEGREIEVKKRREEQIREGGCYNMIVHCTS